MKKLLLSLLLCSGLCLTAAAQTGPPTLPTGPLTSSEVYAVLIGPLGFSPVKAAQIVLSSEGAYGLYFTIDQALALLPDED